MQKLLVGTLNIPKLQASIKKKKKSILDLGFWHHFDQF